MAAEVAVSRATAVLMPTTSPAALTSGPPELPEEIAASVWIRPSRIGLVGTDRAVERRHDAERHRGIAVETEGETDGDDLVTEMHAARVGETGGIEAVAVHAQQCEVVPGVGGEQVRLAWFGLTGETDADRRRTLDDVGVREDFAVAR